LIEEEVAQLPASEFRILNLLKDWRNFKFLICYIWTEPCNVGVLFDLPWFE
jgi:hypothetical protein